MVGGPDFPEGDRPRRDPDYCLLVFIRENAISREIRAACIELVNALDHGSTRRQAFSRRMSRLKRNTSSIK